MLARFEREVQLTSGLTHPNTIVIYDYGRTPEGVFYYAMEYVPGITLDTLVAHDGPQPESRVAHVLRQVAGALSEAHAVRLIHRDIKPANVMLCERGGQHDAVKVLDFGLVKEVEQSGEPGLTAADAMIGTPYYLSPEAIQSPGSVDARTDIYGVGAVGYNLLTGQEVFEGRTAIDVLRQHLHEEPAKPSNRLGRALDPALEELIMACLAKDREQRPTDAAELRRALDDWVRRSDPWTEEQAASWWEVRGQVCLAAVQEARKGLTSRGPSLAVDLAGRVDVSSRRGPSSAMDSAEFTWTRDH